MPDTERLLTTIPSAAIAVLTAVLLYQIMRGTIGTAMRRGLATGERIRAVVVLTLASLLLGNVVVLLFQPGALVTSIVLALSGLAPWLLLLRSLLARLTREAPPKSRTIVAIGAHPDDVELAAGGTLARFADEGHDVHVLVMSGGEVGGDGGTRPLEAAVGGDYLGAKSTAVYDFPDTELSGEELAMARVIERTLEDLAPDLILTHSIHDQHQDHVAVHHAVVRAARRQCSILCFESPSATRAFNPSVFVDIGRYVDVKTGAIDLHRDQRGKPYMSTGVVAGIAAFRGQQARMDAAEGFEPLRLQIRPDAA